MRPEWESRKRHPCFVLPVTRSASMSVCFFQSGKVYKVVGHVEHYAGDQMYIDFAGDRFEVVDEMTGEKPKYSLPSFRSVIIPTAKPYGRNARKA